MTRTLGHIICDNTDAASAQKNVFKEASQINPLENCKDIVGLNFDCIVNDIIGSHICMFSIITFNFQEAKKQ